MSIMVQFFSNQIKMTKAFTGETYEKMIANIEQSFITAIANGEVFGDDCREIAEMLWRARTCLLSVTK